MKIITCITKRSVRETVRELRFKKYYAQGNYTPGDVIEIIDGNRKSPTIILKSESTDKYKQDIRSGTLDVQKLKFSKTGAHADGVVVSQYPMSDIRRYLKDSSLAHKTNDPFLKNFFPKKKNLSPPRAEKKIKATSDGTLSTLSIDRYTQAVKTHHSELQLFVDECRNYFGEKARYGQGSFSYYLGFCKKIPMLDLWQMYGEAKQAKNKTRFEQKKLFWWKIGQFLKKD